VDQGDPVAGYRSLASGCHVTQLGPAFFTKFLYFASSDSTSGPRPLILDQRVAASMRQLASHVYEVPPVPPEDMAAWLWPKNGWSAHRYGEYIHFAHQTSTQLHDLNNDWPDQADLLELALFDNALRERRTWAVKHDPTTLVGPA